MAPRSTPAPQPPAPPAAPPDTHVIAPETLTPFSWGDLAAPAAMPNKQVAVNIKVDVLTKVPEPIRQRAEASLTINTARVAKKANSESSRPRVNYHWDVQAVPNEAVGKEFKKLTDKYAKYRPAEGDIPHASPDSPKGQITSRCGEPLYFRKLESGTYETCEPTADGAFLGVRYSVRPREQRDGADRLPGTT